MMQLIISGFCLTRLDCWILLGLACDTNDMTLHPHSNSTSVMFLLFNKKGTQVSFFLKKEKIKKKALSRLFLFAC